MKVFKMATDQIKHPKVFISYSWSSPEYQERVTGFVDKLIDNGIQVVYDKYDLEEGADIHVFMEKSKTDSSIDKVLILCDKKYAEKADNRKGGVGTETLIISPQVYNDEDPAGKNKKYIPIIMERDASGKVCVPTYLEGKLYFDFSNPDGINSQEFEKLIRYLYNKPLLQAPRLGATPHYILDDTAPNLGTSSKYSDAINALKNRKENRLSYCDDYFISLYSALDDLVIPYNENKDVIEENVFNNVEIMKTLRDEVINIFDYLIRYEQADCIRYIKNVIEKLYYYSEKRSTGSVFSEMQFDHFKFFIQEIFLYTISMLLKEERFEDISDLLRDYYYENGDIRKLYDFSSFDFSYPSFDYRNSRRGLRRVSLAADKLKERATNSKLNYNSIMQADLFLLIYSLTHKLENGGYWYPITLLYTSSSSFPFEIFLKAASKKYFAKMNKCLEIPVDEGFKKLRQVLGNLRDGYSFYSVNYERLCNLDNLNTVN